MHSRRALIATAASLAALPRAARAADPLKVAFVYTGPVGDLGYSYQWDRARLALAQALGPRIATRYVENVPEGPDCERVLRDLAGAGTGLIFSTSFGFMNAALKAGRAYPAVRFEQGTGYKTAPNVAEVNIRWYEARAVCGTIAARTSKSGICGYVAPYPIPEVIMGINAFTIAARKVNPAFRVRVIWVNTWFDPGKEADAAKSLIDQGADILATHTDSPAVMQTAQARGVHAFGQSSDQARFGPTAQLTAIVDHWDPYVIARTRAVLDGSWTTGTLWGGFRDGLLVLAPYGPAVTPPVRAAADAQRAAIVSGAQHPFAGPIRDQAGTVRVAAGGTAPDAELLRMSWFADGVAS